MHHRACAWPSRSGSTTSNVWSSTTRRCWSMSAATPTPTSRRSGSATTSRSSPASTITSSEASGRRRRRCGCVGVGQPAVAPRPGRPRVRRLRPPRRRRDDRPPRGAGPHARRAARPARRRAGSGRGLVRAVGRQGLARRAQGRGSSRSPPGWRQLAEYVEVAHRVGGVEAAAALARTPSRARQFDPRCRRSSAPTPSTILGGLDAARPGTRSSRPSRPSACACPTTSSTPRCWRHRRLRRPEVAVHARPRPGRRRPGRGGRRRSSACRPTRLQHLQGAGLVHGLGRLGVSNAIWDKQGPLGAGEWERVRLHPYLTERMLQQSPALAPLGAVAVQLPRAARRLRLPPRPGRRGDLAAGADPRGGRRLPVDARATPAPGRPCRPSRPQPSSAPRSRRDGSTATPSRRCWSRPGIGSAAGRRARPA